MIGLGVFLLAAVLLSALALDREHRAQDARAKAEREAAVNHSLVLADTALNINDNQSSSIALQLALEAVAIPTPPPEAISALKTVAWNAGTHSILQDAGTRITAVAVSPNGRLALSGSCAALADDQCSQGEIAVWDLDAGAAIRHLEGHTGWVRDLKVLPDRSAFLSLDSDGSALLWDAASGDLIHRTAERTNGTTGLRLSPDGQTAYTILDAGTVLAWEVASGDIVQQFSAEASTASSFGLSADGTTLAVGYADGAIRLWDTASGERLEMFQAGSAAVEALAFRSAGTAGQLLVTSTDDLYLREWDSRTGQLLHETGTPDKTSTLVISPDGLSGVLLFPGGTWIMDLDPWELNRIVIGNEQFGMPTAVALSPDRQHGLIGHASGGLRVINLPFNGSLRRFKLDTPQFGLALSPDGHTMITGGVSSGMATWWDLDSGQVVRQVGGLASGMTEIAFSPDGRSVLVGATDWFGGSGAVDVVLLDAATGAEIHRLEGHHYGVRSSAFSSDGSLLLTGSFAYGSSWPKAEEGRGELLLWDVATGALIRRFDDDFVVYKIAFSPDDTQVIATHGPYADHVTLFDVQTGQVARTFPNIPDTTFRMAVSVLWGPDAHTVWLGGYGGALQLDITTGSILRTLSGAKGAIALDHTADWSYLLGGESTNNPAGIILWEYATGEEVRRYPGAPASLWELTFSPDGQTAYTSSYDGTVIEWQIADWPLDKLLTWVHANRYVRDFTCEERAQYRVEPLCE